MEDGKSFMTIKDRIAAFEKLGNYLHSIDKEEFQQLAQRARNENAWFTPDSVRLALRGVEAYLTNDRLEKWTSAYRLSPGTPKVIAVVMAGNLPLVGFHDFLSVLISGHAILIKPSSKDKVLLMHLVQKLVELEPHFSSRIMFAEQLKNFDAVIATGSDNSARYFHYYFGKYPNIIRKNRTSCAVLTGKESTDELNGLGHDVFDYFGLGCRNASKIFAPAGYSFSTLFESWSEFQPVIHHHKYHNNLEYQKSILLVNREPFLDGGFVLLQQSDKLVSPISVLYYESYNDEGELALKLTELKEKLQCTIGKATPDSIPFGQAQCPAPWDYADRVDTLRFLESLR